jgi:hypothetical protein
MRLKIIKEINFMKIKYLKLIILFAALLATFNNSYAGPRTKLGTMAAPELLIPLGSISTALQGSNLSSVTGVDAMYWNPAGMSVINSKSGEFMASYMNYFADMKMEYIAGAVKLGNVGVLGLSIRNLDFGQGIKVTTETAPEGTGEIINPVYLIGNIGFARAMTDKVFFGTNAKFISERIGQVSAGGFAFDFGLQYVAGKTGLKFGIALKNLGPQLTFTGPGLDRQYIENGVPVVRQVNLQSFDLPTTLEIGLSYSRTFSKSNTISLSSTFANSGFSSDEYRFGLEYNFKNYLFLRGAVTVFPDKLQGESLFGPSFGAGIQYPFGGMTLGFHYAYRLINEKGFNNTNQFLTLNIGF